MFSCYRLYSFLCNFSFTIYFNFIFYTKKNVERSIRVMIRYIVIFFYLGIKSCDHYNLSRCVLFCHVLCSFVTFCLVLSLCVLSCCPFCFVKLCVVLSRCVVFCHVVDCSVTLCDVTLCVITLCVVLSPCVLFCHVVC